MTSLWSDKYWYVIESVVDQTKESNQEQSWNCLRLLGFYIPCDECKRHYDVFINKNRIINSEWLGKLKI